MTTGQLIKELRIKKGMTQEDLADRTDISSRTIQRIENNEVDPRAYTIQAIAEVLEVDYKFLNNSISYPDSEKDREKKVWLPLLHLSGLFIFLFPPIVIWISKKDQIDDMREHGIDVINFQLSMWMIMIPCGIFAFLLITIPVIMFFGFFSTVVIIINTIKVYNNQPYKYPMSFKILK